MASAGKLYLLPVPIGDESVSHSLAAYNLELAGSLDLFFVENMKTARRHLKSMGYDDIARAEMHQLDERTTREEVSAYIKMLSEGRSAAVMSEAGCPGVADPGSVLVTEAHRKSIEVVPLVGPSSILLSIMSSGFNGQSFAFVGYLPVDRDARSRKLRDLEQLSARTGQSQFFIETPYRNMQLFEAMLQSLNRATLVYVGCDLLSETQFIRSMPVAEWKKEPVPPVQKRPSVFGLWCTA